jgi:hypothetical protein
MVKRAAGDDWARGTDGMALFEDDKVRTSGRAVAQVDFVNGATVSLSADALVGISQTHPRAGEDRTDVTVLRGHVDAELANAAKQSLSVTTPAATVRAGREIVFQ